MFAPPSRKFCTTFGEFTLYCESKDPMNRTAGR